MITAYEGCFGFLNQLSVAEISPGKLKTTLQIYPGKQDIFKVLLVCCLSSGTRLC